MAKKRIFILSLCAVLSLLLAGCDSGKTASNAASKVGETVSRIGEDVSGAMSRAESFLEGDDSSVGSRMDDSGTVDSGSDGFIGDESGGESSSLLGDGSSVSSDTDSSQME